MKRLLFPLLMLFLMAFTLLVDVRQTVGESQPLIIVVRDGTGNPLQGVPLVLYVSGPPHREFDNCVTDEQGQCSLVIAPGAYIVTFTQGWRGREFIPVEEQNGESVTDGGVGGFGIYLQPSNEVQIVTFVIGQRDGQLIPLWDMSRDPAAAPQPFAYSDSPFDNQADALAGIDLTPLETAIPDQPTATTTSDAQVIIEQLPPPVLTPTAPATTATPEPTADNPRIPLNVLFWGSIGLVAIPIIILIGLSALRRMSGQRGRSHG